MSKPTSEAIQPKALREGCLLSSSQSMASSCDTPQLMIANPLCEGKSQMVVRKRKDAKEQESERRKEVKSLFPQCTQHEWLLLPTSVKIGGLTLVFGMQSYFGSHICRYIYTYVCLCIYRHILCLYISQNTFTHEAQQSVLFLHFAVISKFSVFM